MSPRVAFRIQDSCHDLGVRSYSLMRCGGFVNASHLLLQHADTTGEWLAAGVFAPCIVVGSVRNEEVALRWPCRSFCQ
jgi:hypothetical protein